MSVEEQDYKSEVLEYAVNQCIDGLLPDSTQSALSVILHQSNEVVWRVATEIYKKSGHQVDFVFVRDTLNLRVELLREKIVEEEKIRKEEEAEISERITKQMQLEKEYRAKEEERFQAFKKNNYNIDKNHEKFDIFVRIRNLIIDFFQVDKNKIIHSEKIKFDTFIIKDLGADEFDIIEIVIAIEEEFDIEINDCDLPSRSSYSQYGYSYEDWNIMRMFYLVVQKLD